MSQGRLTVVELCWAHEQQLRETGRLDTARQVFYETRKYICGSRLGSLPADTVTPRDVRSHLRQVAVDQSPCKANHVRALLSAAFGAALRAEVNPDVPVQMVQAAIHRNPVRDTPRLSRTATHPPHRFVTAEGLRLYARALDASTSQAPKIAALRLSLQLCCPHLRQMLRARVGDIDTETRTWRFLDERDPRRPRTIVLPLTDRSLREVSPLLAGHSPNDLLFTNPRTGRQINATDVGRTVSDISERLWRAGLIGAPFTFSDLRRGAEVRLAALGVLPEVRNSVLGRTEHPAPRFYSMPLAPKLDALARWQDCVFGERQGRRTPADAQALAR